MMIVLGSTDIVTINFQGRHLDLCFTRIYHSNRFDTSQTSCSKEEFLVFAKPTVTNDEFVIISIFMGESDKASWRNKLSNIECDYESACRHVLTRQLTGRCQVSLGILAIHSSRQPNQDQNNISYTIHVSRRRYFDFEYVDKVC